MIALLKIKHTDDRIKIIRALNVNKAHDHDKVSVRMIKIWDEVIINLFLDVWKKFNIVPVDKKKNKQVVKAKDLLHCYSLWIECLRGFCFLFFEFSKGNNLCEHEFRRSDSCISVQKQPPEVFYKKRCFRKIHWKTLLPGSLY